MHACRCLCRDKEASVELLSGPRGSLTFLCRSSVSCSMSRILHGKHSTPVSRGTCLTQQEHSGDNSLAPGFRAAGGATDAGLAGGRQYLGSLACCSSKAILSTCCLYAARVAGLILP